MTSPDNRSSSILAIDDDEIILMIYQKIFKKSQEDADNKILQQSLVNTLSGVRTAEDSTEGGTVAEFELSYARQGREGVEMAREALKEGGGYSVAFVDMRMPPGIDGLETAKLLRELDERICIVFVTAHSDYDIGDITGFSRDNILYIQKPFSSKELLLAARTMTRSWTNNNARNLEALFKAKSDFLATMSHELRTPLTSIIGNTEYLADQVSDAERLQVLHSILSAGKHQLALVNDILDISKIESGKFVIDELPYDLDQLLRDLQQMLSVNARDVGIDLTFSQKNREPHLLLGDPQRLGQILINLLSNAIKFTEVGEVTLTSWSDGEHLNFEVTDSGIGMSPEQVKRLFGRFEQADGTISRRFGGTGLGLYISLNLAQLMEGSIEASSREGEGSTFRLTLPYRPSDIVATPPEQQQSSTSVLSEKLVGDVLIAEDTPALMALERRSLEQMGATVTPAHNGEEAVKLGTSKQFDLILMDMQMPIMDGIEATRVLRAKGVETPIVAISANVMQEHRDAFERVGSNGFLSKPFHSEDLRKIIRPYLTIQQVEVDPEESSAEPSPPAAKSGRKKPPGPRDEMVNDELLELFYENLKGGVCQRSCPTFLTQP